jgi:hypothetical protein
VTAKVSTFYRLDANDLITETGGAWDDFAKENDGLSAMAERVIGTRLLSHISGGTSRLFVWTMLDAVRKLQKPVSRPYRCDSPGCMRHLEMVIEPEAHDGLIVRHRLLRVDTSGVTLSFLTSSGGIRKPVGRCTMCNRLRIGREWREPGDPACVSLASKESTVFVFYSVCPDCRDASSLPPMF